MAPVAPNGGDCLEGLDPQQREAVLAPPGPVLVLAGAGSGKTRVIIRRILHLLSHGTHPENILALTFTNKAAREMRGRLQESLAHRAGKVWMGTFHAVCARILRREGERAGVPRDFSILGRGESLALLKREMAAAGVNSDRCRPPGLLERIGALKRGEGPTAGMDSASPRDAAAALLAPRYERALREAGALDFDDLLIRPILLFRGHPDVLERYRRKFSEILVDEYQDTNPAQCRFLKLLAGGGGRLFAVGDDDQSIYAWRGAAVENIRRFAEDFPGARVCRLERNYRCSGNILASAGAVMAPAAGRWKKKLFTRNPPKEPVQYLAASHPDEEARMLFDHLARRGAESDIHWGDAAIFYRTNTQSRRLEMEARRRGIPYQVVKGQRFFDRAEVQDLAAYLRLILHPADAAALERIVNVPPRGLGPARWAALSARAAGSSREEGGGLTLGGLRRALEEEAISGPAAKALAEFLCLFEDLSSRQVGPAALIEAVLERTGYRAWLREAAERSASAERRRQAGRALEGVAGFAAAARSFEARVREEEGITPGGPDALVRFLEESALAGEVDEMDREGGVLSLMTLHAAKGLEFRMVAVAGVQEGLIPHGRSLGDPAAMEEERRLLYVGFTRAREHLVLSWARENPPEIGGGAGKPSRFLDHLDRNLLVRVGDHSPLPARRPLRREGGFMPGHRRAWYEEDLPPRPLPEGQEKRPGPLPPAAFGPFAPGARVVHPKFGEGTISERQGTGDRTVVTVDFAEAGLKRLVLRHAPLRPAEGDVDGGKNGTV